MNVSNVNAQLLRILHWSGIDRAIAYTILGRAWAVLAGPATLFIIAAFLSKEEQGFYYTFTSILSLQIFFELGLSTVLLQFASHEKAQLEWAADGSLTGDAVAYGRLASLLRRSLLYYGIMAGLMLITVLPAGALFFTATGAANTQVAWQTPWIWVGVVACGLLLISPIFALLEGCGLVAEVARVRLVQGVLASVSFWLLLSQHWGLLAAPIPTTVGLIYSAIWLLIRKRAFLRSLLMTHIPAAAVSWRNEVWPLQWKIALSWISGYFIFQLFTPVLFAFQGPVVAGQMGMSLTIITTISVMALSWMNTKAPLFGNLIARRDFAGLDTIFFRSFRQSFLVMLAAGVAFWGGVLVLLLLHHPLSQRLLDPLTLAILTLTLIPGHIIASESIYLRAHKQEPFLWLSVGWGILTAVSTYVLGRNFGALGMIAGYFVIYMTWELCGGTWIFMQKRKQWHQNAAPGPDAAAPTQNAG